MIISEIKINMSEPKQNDNKEQLEALALEDDFHRNYGKFGLSFELLVNRMRQIISSVFKQNGLKEASYIEAIIANDTADAIQEKCKMTINRYYDWNEEIITVLKPVFIYIRELTNFRNNLIHGTWVPQIALYQENKLVTGHLSRSRSTKPSTSDHLSISSNQLKEVDEDCLEIWSLLLKIQSSILESNKADDLLNITENLTLSDYRERLKIKEVP